MHLKVFVKLKKNLKTPLVWAKNPKNPKKNKKTQKTQKKHWAGFKKRNLGFFQPCLNDRDSWLTMYNLEQCSIMYLGRD
jgi:hypothetical protein